MQFLITAIVAVILLVGVASVCPSGCRCINTSNGYHVNCSSSGLSSIPSHLPTNTYVLYLHANRIRSIKSDTFSNFPNLIRLDLDNNYISVIEDNNFNNLPSLKYLYLNHNRIRSIKSDMFNKLSKLVDLYLNHNRITSIKSDTFNNLRNLNRLQLHYNPIFVVEENAFYNLPSLEKLEFHMYCASCDNISFWRWLKRQRTFPTYIYCNDFHGVKLSSLRNLNYDCTANDGNGSVWCSRHGDWTCLVYMFFMISLQYIMSNI